MYRVATSTFYELFYILEGDGLLDPDNDDHLFCLHFVYLPIINDVLERFARSWLNHKVRTVYNKTPLQLFIMGMQQIQEHHGIVASEYFECLGEVCNDINPHYAIIITPNIMLQK